MNIASIHKRMNEVEGFKKENKIAKQAMKDELENNPAYLEASEEVKTAMEKRKRIKDEIVASAQMQKLRTDISDNNIEISTLEEILSGELMEYYTEKGTNEIEDPDGEKRQLKIIVKIMPKKKSWEDRDDEGKYAAKVEPNLELN